MTLSVTDMSDANNTQPIMASVTTAVSTITLNERRQYLIQHNGMDASSNDTADPIHFSTSSSVTPATAQSGVSKGVLLDESTLPLGPGVSTIKLISTDDPTVTIIPVHQSNGAY